MNIHTDESKLNGLDPNLVEYCPKCGETIGKVRTAQRLACVKCGTRTQLIYPKTLWDYLRLTRPHEK
jgi:ribosomal protein S27AE